VEFTLNHKYPRWNSVCFATLRQFKALCMSSEYIYISFQYCKALFKHPVLCLEYRTVLKWIKNARIRFQWHELQARNHYRGLQLRSIFVSIYNGRKILCEYEQTYISTYLCRLGLVGFRFCLDVNRTLQYFANSFCGLVENKAQAWGRE
jgi:hypothetical protein